MRLAARCYQQVARTSFAKKERVASAEGTPPQRQDALESVEASELASRPSEHHQREAQQHLRGLCARWSLALPAWGEPLNLQGEDPCGAAKRLATGVFGATALLCMRELRSMAAEPHMEDLPPVSPHNHLVPAEAGFWAIFLTPRPDADGARGAQLVAAYVDQCIGDAESIRHSAFVKDGPGCNAMLQPAGDRSRVAADVCLDCEHRYVSRRDTDWVMLARLAREADVPEADTESESSSSTTPAFQRLALFPPHFVCLLQDDPSHSQEAHATLLRLRALFAEAPVAASLPPAYPMHRYSRKLMLKLCPTGRQCRRQDVSDALGLQPR
jgi:hypothetical protein